VKYISVPSGEKVAAYSTLSGRETIPGAKTCGVVPGGVCPKYALLVFTGSILFVVQPGIRNNKMIMIAKNRICDDIITPQDKSCTKPLFEIA
jgi:hypothetical protein